MTHRIGMTSRRNWLLGLFAALLVLSTAAIADSWMPAQTTIHLSVDGKWRFTVVPRPLTSNLAYFQDKVEGHARAGGFPKDKQTSARGKMERLVNAQWKPVWGQPLVNDVAPVDAIAVGGGGAVTFDNWHGMGYGDNAVAIYDRNGKLTRAMGLSDFLPEEYISALPRSVSSMYWRGEPRIDTESSQLIVPVLIPQLRQSGYSSQDNADYVDIRFDLASGERLPDTSSAWPDALERARHVHMKLKAKQAEEKQKFISPLKIPATHDMVDWHGFLREAFFRIDPGWRQDFPASDVIPMPSDPKFSLLSKYVGDDMLDHAGTTSAIMIASFSQNVLIEVLKSQSMRVQPGSLSKTRIYVVVDDKHAPRAKEVLARTGAKFIQIDPNKAIPQRKSRLEEYLRAEANRDDGA